MWMALGKLRGIHSHAWHRWYPQKDMTPWRAPPVATDSGAVRPHCHWGACFKAHLSGQWILQPRW